MTGPSLLASHLKLTLMKIIRIILSPLVFFTMAAGLVVIPIGVLAFMLGSIAIVAKLLFNKPVSDDDIAMTFIIVVWPWRETTRFINADPAFFTD